MSLEKPYEGGFVGNKHHFALRVYIEDTDLGGVVYHANYIRFLERARSDLLRAAGIDQRRAIERGEGVYAVAELRIKYVRPAKLDDELVIISQLDSLHGACCVLSQEIFRDQEVLAKAWVTVAFLGPNGRPKRQPDAWVEKFERIKAETRVS
jgi:acyl-CoA thioester hydrolase